MRLEFKYTVGSLCINFRNGDTSHIPYIHSHETGIQLLKATLEQPEVSSVQLILLAEREKE